jgi:hypothetical protein
MEFVGLFGVIGLASGFNLSAAANVWYIHDTAIALSISIWGLAPVIASLIILGAENSIFVRDLVPYIYGVSHRKWKNNDMAISCLLSISIAELFGLFFLIYAITGVIGYNFLMWCIGEIGFFLLIGICVAAVLFFLGAGYLLNRHNHREPYQLV